ncbi:hypothetical protein DPEC_G00182550 [Dallia pectoralis]|uniref:Uncharacterized protein n=1 Tax=Dallia pectoralis TaxID=75939 RepID=A0ACC2GAK3_DALPE|nr:hypothetical protein DPEC_G00182550 [Dallia pectoralis]
MICPAFGFYGKTHVLETLVDSLSLACRIVQWTPPVLTGVKCKRALSAHRWVFGDKEHAHALAEIHCGHANAEVFFRPTGTIEFGGVGGERVQPISLRRHSYTGPIPVERISHSSDVSVCSAEGADLTGDGWRLWCSAGRFARAYYRRITRVEEILQTPLHGQFMGVVVINNNGPWIWEIAATVAP